MSKDRYYTLQMSEFGASSEAFYSITPDSNLQFAQGGATMAPTAATAVLVNIDPETLQVSAPAGNMAAGVTIITSADVIAGRVLVSPPIDTATVLTLYGDGGQIGKPFVVDAGSGGSTFSWPVGEDQGLSQRDAANLVQKLISSK